jgi:TRAP transporter 4TM/12TM fusion protein
MIEYRRNLTAGWAALANCIAALLPLSTIVYALHILPEFGIVIYKEQFLVYFLTLSLVLTFILIPPRKPAEGAQDQPRRPPWYDLVLVAAALGAGGYTALWYHVLLPQLGLLTMDKIVASTVGILLLLEATRRYAGTIMVAVGLAALSYAYFGHYLSGMFETRPIRFDRLVQYNYMGEGAIHGLPLFVAAIVVTAFLLFGRMLFEVGGGKAISDFAFAAMGRRRGGPAKVSVVASALFGSLSGSASANVATTGMVTIPMMKDTGYPAHKAGAIEAVASTGGLILPPIMAATGFIMAEFLGIPYASVAIAALLPALLFYLCVYLQVDLEAAREGLTGLRGDALPPLRPALKGVAPVAIPIAVLLYSLFGLHQSPETSAFLATVATIAMSVAVPSMRRGFMRYLKVLSETGEAVVYIALVCAIAGLVMGVLGLTGLGASISNYLVQIAGGEVWLLLLFAALGSIVLGMGVPVTATYIILVVLIGPALVKAGVPELSAHMFIFYFGTLSFLTPPVCISVFVAAAIAKAEPMKTAFFAVRLAVVAYVIPFLFVFNDAFLMQGGTAETANALIGSVGGIVLLSVGLVGHLALPLGPVLRALTVAAGFATLSFGAAHWEVAGAGWALAAALYLLQRRRRADATVAGRRAETL